MIFIVIMVIFSLLILSKIILTNKLLFSLIAVFIIWNGLWLSISTFNAFDTYSVSDRAYFYQLLGFIMLVIGFLISSKRSPNKIITFKEYNIEKPLIFKVIIIFSLILIVYAYSRFNLLILTLGASEGRDIFFADKAKLLGNKYLGYLWSWVISPIFYLVLTLLLYHTILRNKKIIWTSIYILFILLFGFVGAGRQHYVLIVLGYVILSLILKKSNINRLNNLNKQIRRTSILKRRIILFSAAFSLLIVMGFITSIRKGNSEFSKENIKNGLEEFFEQAIVYQIGPYRAFDYGLKNNYLGQIGQLYGRGTLAGVEEVMFTFFSLLGNNQVFVPINGKITSVLQKQQILVGDEHGFNFAYTHLMIFYLDFKIWGIIIIPLIYGLLFRKAANYYIDNPNIFSLTLILFLTLTLLESHFKYGFQTISSIFVIIGSIYFSNRLRKKRLKLSTENVL